MNEIKVTGFCIACGKGDLADHEHYDHGCEFPRVRREAEWPCKRCGTKVYSFAGRDADCKNCGACYNGSGQRLRDDWRSNPSCYDDEIGDLEGYEMQHANDY